MRKFALLMVGFVLTVSFTFNVLHANASTDATAVNFEHLHKTALIAAASYQQYEDAKKNITSQGWELVRHYEMPGNAVQYLLLRNGQEQVIAVRGTSNAENVVVDLDLQLEPDAKLGIDLHKGFAAAALSVWQDVESKLDKTMPVRTTGHSLGGAVAVILAMHLHHGGYLLTDVTTYGQPKVTNVQGAKAYADLPLTRVVTPMDVVPIVPPLSPLDLKRLDIYWHNGQEIVLVQAGQYALLQGMKSMLRAAGFLNKVPDETNVQAHQMDTYLNLLNHNRKQAQEVPFKTQVNLFGLSFE